MNMLDIHKGSTCTWEMEHFSLLPHQTGEGLMSPKFVVDPWKELDWWLVLYPKGRHSENEGFASIYLHNDGDDAIDLPSKFAFFVTLVSTEPSSSITWSKEIHGLLLSKGFSKFVKLSDIFEENHLYLPQDKLTLRCHLLPIEKFSEEKIFNDESVSASNFAKRYSFRTGLVVQRSYITLHVRNINKHENRLEKASFDLESSRSLNLSLHFIDFLKIDFVRIEVRQTSLPLKEERLFVKCKMTVISAHKKYQHSKESTHLFQWSLDDIWHFPTFIETSNLTRDKYLYLEDTLLLQCEFAFSCISKVFHSESNYYAPLIFDKKEDRSVSELVTNLGELYRRRSFCDVELRAGDEAFPVHKVVLCAMSPVFRAMFENDSKEKDSNVVEVEGVDPDTLRRMLAFIHSDDLKEDLSLENAAKLFSAADKYGIESLRRRCAILLVSSLSVASVCDVLVLADAHQDNFLLTAVHNFIFSHTKEIFYSKYWKNFVDNNPKLSGEIKHQMLLKKG